MCLFVVHTETVEMRVSPASDHYNLTSQSSENSSYFQSIENV